MRRPALRRLGAALAAALASCAPRPPGVLAAEPGDVPAPRLSPRSTVDGDCASTWIPPTPATRTAGALTFEGGFELVGTRRDLGGLSGLEAVDADTLLAVADIGRLVTIELGTGRDGAPVARCKVAHLLGADGKPLGVARRGQSPAAVKLSADAEGLALVAPDRIAVSFERDHRIAFFDLATLHPAGAPIDFSSADGLTSNGGIEALAVLPSGELLAGAESLVVLGGGHPVWRLPPPDPAAASAAPREPTFRIEGERAYSLVSFDATPAGGVLALERLYTPGVGNRSRIEWLAPGAAESAAGTVQPVELARLTGDSGLELDNFEGIAAAPGADGRTDVWIVSDDNFSDEQKTLLYRFSFDERALLAESAVAAR